LKVRAGRFLCDKARTNAERDTGCRQYGGRPVGKMLGLGVLPLDPD
jgi:hypothetical protein